MNKPTRIDNWRVNLQMNSGSPYWLLLKQFSNEQWESTSIFINNSHQLPKHMYHFDTVMRIHTSLVDTCRYYLQQLTPLSPHTHNTGSWHRAGPTSLICLSLILMEALYGAPKLIPYFLISGDGVKAWGICGILNNIVNHQSIFT